MNLSKYTIYSTPTCHYCHILKGWLEENGIPYEYKDVASDMAARAEMVEKSQQLGVPVSVIKFNDEHEEVVIGWDQGKIADLLHLSV